MVIEVDTREQNRLPFRVGGAVEEIRVSTLPFGDYRCIFKDSSVPPVYFERKGMGDLFGTMTSGYSRFKKELERAKESGVDLILAIEGTLADVLAGYPHSNFSGDSMTQKLFTMMIRHRLDVVFCSSRLEMCRFITEYYSAIGREKVILNRAGKSEGSR